MQFLRFLVIIKMLNVQFDYIMYFAGEISNYHVYPATQECAFNAGIVQKVTQNCDCGFSD
jgi:hypothetical protein